MPHRRRAAGPPHARLSGGPGCRVRPADGTVRAGRARTFVRSTLLDQASRIGTFVPVSLRLAHVTGLIDVLNAEGTLSLHAGSHSLFSGSVVADISSASPGGCRSAVTAVLVAAIAIGHMRHRAGCPIWSGSRSPPWRSHAALILSYSAFFYHYPAFVAPWLALAAGGAAGSLAGSPRFQRILVAAFVVVVLAVAGLQVAEVAPLSAPTSAAIGRLIPKGACVVTDETSIDDFRGPVRLPPPGCSDIIDSLATTLALSHGVSVQGGAASSGIGGGSVAVHPQPVGLRMAVARQRPPDPVDARAESLVPRSTSGRWARTVPSSASSTCA